MKCKVKISFEADEHPPETFETEVEASNIRPVVGMALEFATNERGKSFHWQSMVIFIEKTD